MPRPSVVYLAIVDYLKDGKWHDAEAVMRRAIEAVPPGKAVQRAERTRAYQFKGVEVPPRQRNKTMEKLIRVGSRDIARETLSNNNRFIYNSDRTKIRLTSVEERGKASVEENKKRAASAARSRLVNAGIDPDKHETLAAKKERLRKERESWTPEQWRAWHKENSRKSWEARKAEGKKNT